MKKISIIVLILFSVISNSYLVSAEMITDSENNSLTVNENQEKLSPEEIKSKNINFRKKFGLTTEEVQVNKVMQLNENDKVHAYGVELSKEEYKVLKERFDHLDNVMPKVMEYIEQNVNKEAIGGVFVDQRENSKLYISYLDSYEDELKEEIEAIKNLFGSENIQFNKVNFSYEKLNMTHKKIFEDKEMLFETHNIIINDIKTDIQENKVIVGVINLDSKKSDTLKSIYGETISVISSDIPVKPEVTNGFGIINSHANTTCSSGFSAYSGSTYYIVTAGHCSDGYATNQFTANGTNFGTMYYYNVYPTGNSDVGLITTTQANTSHYVTGYGSLTNYNYGDGYVGQLVCISAQYSDNCGNVTSTDYSSGTSGLYDLNTANYDAVGGDSGGTIRSGSTLYGIHYGDISGSKPDAEKDEAYSKLGNILNRLGILPIVQ